MVFGTAAALPHAVRADFDARAIVRPEFAASIGKPDREARDDLGRVFGHAESIGEQTPPPPILRFE
ncbi:hypothetical protein ACWDR1_09955 [Streptosporangium sandarakinum]|uniref:hypothetical protein n=1 Tax=Streptosporangium sandarakinum TaxID=1260955 RepID=UPI0033BD699F